MLKEKYWEVGVGISRFSGGLMGRFTWSEFRLFLFFIVFGLKKVFGIFCGWVNVGDYWVGWSKEGLGLGG